MALWRIGATVPTDEQIAQIYNEEKFLFQEGAQASLSGSSNTITALHHDVDTGELHVGTSSGRSAFQGLRRVDEGTTPITNALYVSKHLKVEG